MYLKNYKTIVIKVGSSLLIDAKKKVRRTWLEKFALDIKDLNQDTFDLSVINPNIEEEALLKPEEILKEIDNLEKESTKLLDDLKKLI